MNEALRMEISTAIVELGAEYQRLVADRRMSREARRATLSVAPAHSRPMRSARQQSSMSRGEANGPPLR